MASGYVRLDGPAPQPPRFSLLTVASKVDEGDERWAAGGNVWPYPCGVVDVRNLCVGGNFTRSPVAQVGPVQADAYEASIGFQCNAAGLGDFSDFQQRARTAFEAMEASAVEKEYLGAAQLVNNVPLKGNAGNAPTILNAGAATNLKNGLAMLEKAIAATGRRGVIHMSAALFSNYDLAVERDGQNVETRLGTLVVPGYGYDMAGVVPQGGSAATGTQEWAFATGLLEYRSGPVRVLPDSPVDGLDRSSNAYTVWVTREYLLTWDRCVHAAVKIDRCQAAC